MRDARVRPSVRTFALDPGSTIGANLKQIAVTAGADYTLDTTIAATAAAEHAGYVTIVFLDGAGKGIRRDNIWFEPSSQRLGTVQTDARGGFLLSSGVRFDHVLFESWDTFPDRTLPETDPNTLSSLLVAGERP